MVIVYGYTTGNTINQAFPYYYNFKGYEVGIIGLSGLFQRKNVDDPHYICCDIIKESFITQPVEKKKSVRAKILRPVLKSGNNLKQEFHPFYVPVTHSNVKSIRLYIIDSKGTIVTGSGIKVQCVLHFRPRVI